MMKISKAVFAVSVLCSSFFISTASVQAHHSVAAEFDADHLVTVTGTLTRLDWILPHSWLYVDAKADDGTIQHWGFETPTAFRRGGASAKEYFMIGETLTVTAMVARNGALKGYI